MKLRTANLLLLTATIGVALGCASTPSIGDRISQHGENTKQIGNDWGKGESMVKKGLKLRKESESLANKSRSRLDEGEQLIAEGQRLQRESEVSFQQQFGVSLASMKSEAK